MRKLVSIALGVALLAACVTVNVYFPASAAERAADIFVKDVYGIEGEAQPNPATPPDQSHVPRFDAVQFVVAWLVPAAYAQQPDINISTPAINALRADMESRHQRLKAFYASGAVGMSDDGLIVLRDPAAIDLKQRNMVKKLVADENKDRNRLYLEVAIANQHPEWESNIRGIFAQRWVANAPGGWWYRSGGSWRQN